MVLEDLCPSTNRECHNRACEIGGCRKARSKPAAKVAVRRRPQLGVQPSNAVKQRDQELEAAAKLTAEVALIFASTLDALDHADAALTHLQQSLGVKSSPRLEQLRSAATGMRDFLKEHPLPRPETAGPDEQDAEGPLKP